jgi:hypothetical protein
MEFEHRIKDDVQIHTSGNPIPLLGRVKQNPSRPQACGRVGDQLANAATDAAAGHYVTCSTRKPSDWYLAKPSGLVFFLLVGIVMRL